MQTMKKACLTHTESHSGTCGIFGQYLLFMSSTLDEEKYRRLNAIIPASLQTVSRVKINQVIAEIFWHT